MDIIIGLVILIPIIICCLLMFYIPHYEKEEFNNGICKVCGQKLNHFDTDSQGGRGYTCPERHYYVWVSYHSVDN